jgi:hypothetical protein
VHVTAALARFVVSGSLVTTLGECSDGASGGSESETAAIARALDMVQTHVKLPDAMCVAAFAVLGTVAAAGVDLDAERRALEENPFAAFHAPSRALAALTGAHDVPALAAGLVAADVLGLSRGVMSLLQTALGVRVRALPRASPWRAAAAALLELWLRDMHALILRIPDKKYRRSGLVATPATKPLFPDDVVSYACCSSWLLGEANLAVAIISAESDADLVEDVLLAAAFRELPVTPAHPVAHMSLTRALQVAATVDAADPACTTLVAIAHARPDDADNESVPMIYAAAARGHLAVVRWALLFAGPIAGILAPAAAKWAAFGGHMAVVDWLQLTGTEVRGQTLCGLAARGDLGLFQRALAAGAPDLARWEHWACLAARHDRVPMLEWLLDDTRGGAVVPVVALVRSAVRGAASHVVDYLLRHGGTPVADAAAAVTRERRLHKDLVLAAWNGAGAPAFLEWMRVHIPGARWSAAALRPFPSTAAWCAAHPTQLVEE